MEIWETVIIIYVAISLITSVVIFSLRKKYSPERTSLFPSLLVALYSGLIWIIILPYILINVRSKK